MLDCLLHEFGEIEIFEELAKKYNVRGVEVHGKNGAICGSLGDRGLLVRYMEDGEWSGSAMNVFHDFFSEHAGGTFMGQRGIVWVISA